MQIEFMWKDVNSGGGGCPALMETVNEQGERGYFVVGKKPSTDALAQVRAIAAQNDSGIADDEDAVFVPANVLDRLRDLP